MEIQTRTGLKWKGEVLLTSEGKQGKRRAELGTDGCFDVWVEAGDGYIEHCCPFECTIRHSRSQILLYGTWMDECTLEFNSADFDKVCAAIMLARYAGLAGPVWCYLVPGGRLRLRKMPEPITHAIPQWARDAYMDKAAAALLQSERTCGAAVEGCSNAAKETALACEGVSAQVVSPVPDPLYEQREAGLVGCDMLATQACQRPVGWNSESAKVWDPGKPVRNLPE